MFKLSHPVKSPLFDYYAPRGETCLGLLSIPHSGETIPEDFKSFLHPDPRAQREDVDYKVHELVDIDLLQEQGVAVLVAHVHRICVDLNRSENNCVLFWKQNTQGKPLVLKNPTKEEEQRFIETYHRPYFEVLKANLRELEKMKSVPVNAIDLHSMPSTPTSYHLQQNPTQNTHRADFCLSDKKGLTCNKSFIEFFKHQLEERGHQCALNDPYVGGYITEFIHQFRTNNIQIEINRRLYMNEVTKELDLPKMSALRKNLTEVIILGLGQS